jgi:response regulator of citrate/malate metabolism
VRSAQKRLVKQAQQLIESTEKLRQVLAQYQRATNRLVRRVESGDRLVDTVERIGGRALRPELTDVLDEFETARHNTRLAMFALAQEEHTSISELARALGISRQLGSRLAREAEAGPIRS